ncbi:zinc ribbon domain-containing protein [Streptomyces sp. AP-93]|uniref:zinc ribbon domain-containing protein n=1 Tax=Streptomyces sp. AP-93 TaxID=2929048 RepID=UPI001FAFFDDC|nr:zinc ribbon domain-containing protein [Streptomyces sp. AP-93]MCJ0870543.1 zinc ribbon domain-containing protein [Streptomyces sp. AP-93]
MDTVSGEVLNTAALGERVRWLTTLVESMAAGVIGGHWSRAELDLLASGVGPSGERLPSNAWMALRTLGWTATVPEGLYVPDRVRRVAEEQAGRVLRSAEWRAELVDAVLTTWSVGGDPMKRTDEEWAALREACPQGTAVPASVFRSRTRQVLRFLTGYRRLPVGLCELEAAPGGGHQVVLAAADKQLATLVRCEDEPARYAVLTVRLPARPDPRTRSDWCPVRIRFRLPPTIDATAALHAPTLRLRAGRLRLDVAHTTGVPKTLRSGHGRAVAFDYGLNTLLTGGTLTLTGGIQSAVLTDGQPVFLRMDGVLAKADRLRVHAEHLWAKAAHLECLLDGQRALGRCPDPPTVAKLAVLRTEHAWVSRRRERLNGQIAKAAARFMVDHARATGASVIYLEDLRDMESRGKGRTLNTRLSGSVRGQIVADARHQAARHGIAVVIVPARGTSKYCPRCLTAFRHHAAPDNTRPGWKWATCPHPDCGYSADRDVAAWQRIGARGLQHQHLTVLDRTTGTYLLRRTVQELDRPVRHPKPTHPDPPFSDPQDPCADRTKAGPTRNRPVPRQRRRVPAPPATPVSTGPGGKRPAGRQPQSPTHRIRRRRGRQAPHTMSTPNRHQPTGARLGAGFHLHTHATPLKGPRRIRDSFPTGPNTHPHPGKPKLI